MGEQLATEIMHELKASAKRWFIIAIVELVVIVSMLASFFWYISLPVEEVSQVTQEGTELDNSTMTQTVK